MPNWGQSPISSFERILGRFYRTGRLGARFRYTKLRFRCISTLTPILLAGSLGAQPQPGRPVSLNFENARVTDVVRSVAAMLGLNVVFTDVPDKRMSFSTSAPVRPEEV